MPYKIPKNRTTVKTIKMKNGILTGEADNQGNMYWFKDGKYITPYQMENYKYYDPSIKGYRKLGNRAKMYVSSGTVNFNDVYNPVYTPNLDRLYSEAARKSEEKYALEQEQAIPLQNQDWITLRTKGKMNLTDIPMNMLDSIAINAGRSGTDFWTDMGLVGKESTFSGLSKALGRPYNPSMEPVSVHALTNNHAWYYSPEGDYVAAVNKILYPDPFKETLTDAKKVEVENNVKYATEHGLIKGNTPQYSDYILADAFKRYQTNPAGYNPGQKSYVPMLNGIRQELQGEKQLQNYWNTRGKQEYARGQKEGMAYGGSLKSRTWDDLSMAERAEMMKVAINNGIYNLDDIRSQYNEYAKGGSIHIDPSKKGTFTAAASRHGKSVQEFASRVLAHPENYSPAMRKKANFARNAAKWKHADGGNLYPIGGLMGTLPSNAAHTIVNNLQKAKNKATEHIRQRLYDNVIPFGYNDPGERVASAVILNKPSSKQEMPEGGNYDALDELWATYLNIPQDKRHYDPILKVSKYKPTKSKNANATYYSIPFSDDEKQEIIDSSYAEELRPRYYRASSGMSPELGEYIIDKGRDSKGDYASYYDVWDLNPFRGITNIGNKATDFLGLDKIGDMSLGIGKPVEIYDRIYLDDYYNVPNKDRGGHYLPEVTIRGKKHRLGGPLAELATQNVHDDRNPYLFLSPLKLP